MAGNAYLTLVNGIKTVARGIQSSVGAGSAGAIPALDASGKLDSTFMPTGIGADSQAVIASAALTAPALVNVYNNAGVLNVRYADNTVAGQECNGYITSTIANGATGTVFLAPGQLTGLSGMTIGAKQFLGTTGARTETAPSTAGNIIQEVGVALSATVLQVNFGSPITYN